MWTRNSGKDGDRYGLGVQDHPAQFAGFRLQRKESGIPLPVALYDELVALGEELGVPDKLSEFKM